MRSPLFESTDGRLFRLTLQGTLAPASERDVAAQEARKSAGGGLVGPLPGPRLTAGDFLRGGA